jgi:O-antigen ligase
MSNNVAKAVLVLSAATLLIAGVIILRPGYFSSASGLSTLIGGELLLAAVANFRKAYLPTVLVCFLIAGTGLPFQAELLQGRWVALGLGAALGMAVYLKTHNHKLTAFHLFASFCVLSAFVSALISDYPSEALLKALSLFLLLLYAGAGARTAIPWRPERFFASLVVAIEILMWIAAICYLALRNEIFGNPNSLGAIMAVACIPVLLWAFLTAQPGTRRLRLGAELMVALLLLFSSFSRASITAAMVSSLLLCVALRQYRVLIRGVAIVVLLAICAVILVPRHTGAPSWDGSESIGSVFLYKGKRDEGVLGSRRTVWQQTWNVIREKPWFGSGFGTSHISGDMTKLDYAAHHIDSWVIREHGNSYLAIIEWTGLLGVMPFFALLFLTARNASLVFAWVRRTQDAFSPAIPAAAIIVAGLIDAAFEDWMFAVGYYLCVFFWVMAFILVDVMPSRGVVVYVPESKLPEPTFGMAVPTK